MKVINAKFVRSNEINDIFELTFKDGSKDFISYPRSMEITISDLIN